MIARNAASERQVQAAQPQSSTWLSANAGSGKTRVLTDRVARILLQGTDPQKILCLTYTKAAAAEMQNRLFRRLGEWAMLDDATLAATLEELGAWETATPTAGDLARARTLFARAIETPGGLKIQTIHAFCAALLRRFPLEAGVSPQFAEMEDRAADMLRAEIVEDMASGPLVDLVDGVAAYLSDSDFAALARSITSARDRMDPAPTRADLLRALDLPDGYTMADLAAETFTGGEEALLKALREALVEGSKTDVDAAAALMSVGVPGVADLPVLEKVFLFGATAKTPFGAKIGRFPTKATQARLASSMDELDDFMARVEGAFNKRLGLAAAARAEALHRFAAAFLPEYDRRKELRGWLDFDDLIGRARRLLRDPGVASWVLYRLDGGIEHILVDEAQDTSPAQWDVIEALTQEFMAGQGAERDRPRTLFVVGDRKQSIYSFQGADAAAFDTMRRTFKDRLTAAGPGLQDLTLEYSFRSAPAILQLVDRVFAPEAVPDFAKDSQHRAFRSDMPGRVDLWPVVDKAQAEEDGHWTDPVDRPGQDHHATVLAQRIAHWIKAQVEGGETLPHGSDRRPMRYGDVLILVRRRSDLFAAIIRACKQLDLPIAGADRLKVGAELAVKDLAAVLSFLATPEDDLSLASALKSPLFGWSEQELYALAHGRDGAYLWEVLRRRADLHPQTVAILTDLRDHADFLRPYDLIDRILTRHDGRRRLLGRLGPEAEDGIDALLSQALAYERSEIPSLTGFLTWMETDDLEIKRQMGNVGDQIRVMTVHGAKGLEAPVVILPDTALQRAAPDPDITHVETPDGPLPLWRTVSAETPAAMREAREAHRARQEAERLRLLYVALTRAESWLVVAASGDLSKDASTWYERVETALRAEGAAELDCDGGPGLRLATGDWNGAVPESAPAVKAAPPALPDLFRHPVPPPAPGAQVLKPSDLGGAKALPGEAGLDEAAAKLRGTHIHLLLEHLPTARPDRWADSAPRILPEVDPADLPDLLAEATTTLTAPALAPFFAPDALAEVPITSPLGNGRLHGVIDRLIVTRTHIRLADFKSNAVVPATPLSCPEGILRQMGAYLVALERIYPDRTIEVGLIWTRTATHMVLPHESLRAALARTQDLDGAASPS
ncbi:double-strand break repair helicase AddA [Chachezhania sediminis]|uniref:double-strand break repair helicase AddA n=1 Tax=Chachezhania sediminis TaxID=2599291 RepID=UPI00131C955B|nr:double-strand break repair helicase AddA [Chachezhania sediminis]